MDPAENILLNPNGTVSLGTSWAKNMAWGDSGVEDFGHETRPEEIEPEDQKVEEKEPTPSTE